MNQEKKERVFLASVAMAVLILILGIVILICQGIAISNRKKELAELTEQKRILRELANAQDKEIEYWELRETIIDKAREHGYKFPDDIEKYFPDGIYVPEG